MAAKEYRQQIGVVMQDDSLMTGSLAENIAFFEPMVDQDRVQECARLASIDQEILAMPMGYHSRIGDMGSALSGGQRQRILLARALYRKPSILIIDEGTANLDAANESAVLDEIRALGCTIIAVSHNTSVHEQADRFFTLENGVLQEQFREAGHALQRSTS